MLIFVTKSIKYIDELEWDLLTNWSETLWRIHLRAYWQFIWDRATNFIWNHIDELEWDPLTNWSETERRIHLNYNRREYWGFSLFWTLVFFLNSNFWSIHGDNPDFIPYCYYYCFFPCIFPYQNTVDIYHRKTRIVTIEFTLEKANLENTGDSPYFELSCFSWIVIFGRSTGIILILSLPVIVVVYPTIILLLFFIIPY
jgi:hypothetical protein